MHGHRISYVRVSSFDQNPEPQLKHVPVDQLFTDKASGKDTQRPELDRLLVFAREGDTVVVHSMDRLARNLDDLRLIVQKLTKRGIISAPNEICFRLGNDPGSGTGHVGNANNGK